MLNHRRPSRQKLGLAGGGALATLAISRDLEGLRVREAVRTAETDDVSRPFGDDPRDFIAAFSNIGPEIDVTGPGIGVISTVPGGHGVMSGTSMACPAVAGFAARLLAQDQALLSSARDATRVDAMARALLQRASSLGFTSDFEGRGLPR